MESKKVPVTKAQALVDVAKAQREFQANSALNALAELLVVSDELERTREELADTQARLETAEGQVKALQELVSPDKTAGSA